MGEAKQKSLEWKRQASLGKPMLPARFNLYAIGTRLSLAHIMSNEVAYWSDLQERLLGVVFQDVVDGDFGWMLLARDRIGRDVFLRGAPEGLRVIRKAAWQVDLYDLIATYGLVRARAEPAIHVINRRPVMTLEEALLRVERMVGAALEWAALESFLPETQDPAFRRSALASSFVATLELARQGKLELDQQDAFAPLYVRAA